MNNYVLCLHIGDNSPLYVSVSEEDWKRLEEKSTEAKNRFVNIVPVNCSDKTNCVLHLDVKVE